MKIINIGLVVLYIFIVLIIIPNTSASYVSFSNDIIYIAGTGTETITEINTTLANSSRFEDLGGGEWLAKYPIVISSTTAILNVSGNDCTWLKLQSVHHINVSYIKSYGILNVTNSKITSWNTTLGTVADVGDTNRSYIYITGSDGYTNIVNSNLSCLGTGDASGPFGKTGMFVGSSSS